MAAPAAAAPARPRVRGKFLWLGERKFHVRGVTYGTFRADADGLDYPSPDVVARDFADMAAAGFNTVRTYTVPPRWLLDVAQRHGLLVMVGHPWEQHVAFLTGRRRRRSIEDRVRAGVRACAGHPALLCHTIGNEIPASIVRWHGHRAVERFLERLYRAVKDEDPEGLVTYVNFPTTEYLELPFLDFVAFNVYLEQEERLRAYLGRLQVLAGDRPLVMAEIGLDSRRNGLEAQAQSLAWQLRCVFEAGCAGATVFAWTDEWHRGGHDIDDWDFGLVTRAREPKPALEAVRRTMAQLPMASRVDWPRVSVVVCSYNGSRTIDETLKGLRHVEYPDFEVIVVDDGSRDATPEIARRHGVRLISTENRGLSSARNTGAEAATGEIIAYLDDDAVPDPHWLTHLALAYLGSDHAAMGGPNVAHPEDPPVADCVANAPGGPIHVLLSDTQAEHVPGCNLSVRRSALMAIGGFDPAFRVAGDDVDFCWRLQERGWTIGFSPAAMVSHHRRHTVRAFWRQQRGYGRAEAMLERKWPQKYNGAGHVSWAGRIYAPGGRSFFQRRRIYYGTWGTGFFQRLYAPQPALLSTLPLMPEWLLVLAILAGIGGLGLAWSPLLLAVPIAVAAAAATLLEAWVAAGRAQYVRPAATRRARLRRRALTAALHLVHAHGRLCGRLTEGLAPWARRSRPGLAWPLPREHRLWDEQWAAVEDRLAAVERQIRATGSRVRRGDDFEVFDLEVRGGAVAGARLRMAVEEHGAGRQLLRFGVRPRVPVTGAAALALASAVGMGALAAGALVAAGVLLAVALVLAATALLEAAFAAAVATSALQSAIAGEPAAQAGPLESVLRGLQPGERVAVLDSSGDVRTLVDLLLALQRRDEAAGNGRSATHRDASFDADVLAPEAVLLPATVADNIALGRPDAGEGEVVEAAKVAGADAFIRRLPRGYRTPVGAGGLRLGPHERLRIAVARAVLRDAPILVLGEPLVDRHGSEDADDLRAAIDALARTRRTLHVAEKLHAGVEFDRIVMIEDGRVVEQGRPDELPDRHGAHRGFVVAGGEQAREDEAAPSG